MVFQNYALYPHMTVYDNIAFSLRIKKVPEDEVYARVTRAAEILGISEYLLRKPRALSGGQRQRVAIGRAMVRDSKVFLMDEPLSNLDAKLRNQMRAEIILLRQQLDTTFVYVTHDQTEAMTLPCGRSTYATISAMARSCTTSLTSSSASPCVSTANSARARPTSSTRS